METTTKKWYQSKTIWGIAITLIAFLLNRYFGVTDLNIPESEDAEILLNHIERIKAAKSDVMVLISEFMAGIGGLLAIIGRVQADTKLTK